MFGLPNGISPRHILLWESYEKATKTAHMDRLKAIHSGSVEKEIEANTWIAVIAKYKMNLVLGRNFWED